MKKKSKEAAPTDPVDERFWRDKDDIFNYEYNKSRVLYSNDFESDLKGWYPREPMQGHYDYGKYKVATEISTEESHSGTQCMRIYDRRFNWNGAYLDVTNILRDDMTAYEVMVWVKLRPDASSCRVRVMLEAVDSISTVQFPTFIEVEDFCQERGILSKFRLPVGSGDDDWDTRYPKGYEENGWVLLRGKFNIRISQYANAYLYIETTREENSSNNEEEDTNDIYVDDFVLLRAKKT